MNRRTKVFSFVKAFWLRIAGALALVAGIVTHADSIADVWRKYFDKQPGLGGLDQPINLPTSLRENNGGVFVELVQVPSQQSGSELLFDVYLKNETAKDFLLTKVSYDGESPYLSAEIGAIAESHPFAPDSSYDVPIGPSLRGGSALSPPYLLKSNSRAAIRFRFINRGNKVRPKNLRFSLFDSRGRKIAAVNGRSID